MGGKATRKLFPVKVKNKYGYMNRPGSWVWEPRG